MNKAWLLAPLLLLSGFVSWIVVTGIQGKREHDAFMEMKQVDLGVLNAPDAQNRRRALQALVKILGPGSRYGVEWKTKKAGQWIDYELSVGPATGHDGLLYCEITNASMKCFAYFHLKEGVLSKVANSPQANVDPLLQLEKLGFHKQPL